MTVLHPALRKLWWMNTKARFRQMYRASRTVRGALLSAFSAVLFCFWIGNFLFMRYRSADAFVTTDFLQWLPLAMLALCVMTFLTGMGERSMVFSPSEVDSLFPAPFLRRELVVYKLAVGLTGQLFMAFVFSTILSVPTSSFPRTLLAMTLAVTFIQWVNTVVTLALEGVAARVFSAARAAVLCLVIAPIVWSTVGTGIRVDSIDAFKEALHAPWLVAATTPFRLFTNVISSPSWSEAAPWIVAGCAINVVLALAIVWVDSANEEVILTASQAHFERMKQWRAGRLGKYQRVKTGRIALPAVPRLFGAGPIVRKQVLMALRSPSIRNIAILALIGGSAFNALPFPGKEADTLVVWVMIGAMACVTFIISQSLRFDFRGDYDVIDYFKTLPLRPIVVSAAEVGPISIVVIALQMLFALTAGAISNDMSQWMFAVAAMMPFTVFLFAIENSAFLLFPIRFTGTMQGDFHAVAKHTFMMFAKSLVMGLVAAVAAGVGFATYFLAGSITAAFVAGWIVVWIAAGAMVFVTAMVYEKTDVSAVRAE